MENFPALDFRFEVIGGVDVNYYQNIKGVNITYTDQQTIISYKPNHFLKALYLTLFILHICEEEGGEDTPNAWKVVEVQHNNYHFDNIYKDKKVDAQCILPWLEKGANLVDGGYIALTHSEEYKKEFWYGGYPIITFTFIHIQKGEPTATAYNKVFTHTDHT